MLPTRCMDKPWTPPMCLNLALAIGGDATKNIRFSGPDAASKRLQRRIVY